MLLHALGCKVSCTLVGLGTDYLQAAQYVLAEIGQCAGIIGLLQDIVRAVIVGRIVQET